LAVLNVKFILTSPTHIKPKGLRNFSQAQVEAVEKYKDLSEPELREKVEEILNSVSEKERLENAIAVETGERIKKNDKKTPVTINQKHPVNRFGEPLKNFSDAVDVDAIIPVKPTDILTHKTRGDGFVFDVCGNWIEIRFYNEDDSRYLIYKPEMFIDKHLTVNNIKSKLEPVKKSRNYKRWEREKELKRVPTFSDYNKPKIKKIEIEKPNIYDNRNLRSASIPETTEIPYSIGDVVYHRKFGGGKVININNDNRLVINFDGDIKTLSYKPDYFI
jgi:hypothetical protein